MIQLKNDLHLWHFRTLPTRLVPGLCAVLLWLLPCVHAQQASAQSDEIESLPIPQLLAQAPTLPPNGLFVLAAKLFAAGRRDEATRFFYIAQLRAKYELATSPDQPPDGAPALYAALQDTIGRPINEWAFGNVLGVTARMQEALDWDAAQANAVTPKNKDPAALADIRAGLAKFRLQELADAENIRRERLAHGLANRP